MFVHFIFLASLQIFTSVIFATANGTYTLRYDANGNLIKRESTQNGQSRQLIWDEENRLACTRDNQQGYLPQTPDSCKAQGNSNAPTFTYDAAGVRVAKNGGALSLTINQNYSEKANKAYKHIFVGTQRLVTKLVGNNSKKLEGAQWYYHGDHLSSSSYVTNADGAIVEHLSYFPYGETWVQEKDSLPINYGFTAKELDQETGYYYFGARYYDPRTSVWVSTDPALGKFMPTGEQSQNIRALFPFGQDEKEHKESFDPLRDLPGHGGIYNSPNLATYAYTQHNPLKFVDDNGEFTITIYASKRGVSANDMQRIEQSVGEARELMASAAIGAIAGSIDYLTNAMAYGASIKQGIKQSVIWAATSGGGKFDTRQIIKDRIKERLDNKEIKGVTETQIQKIINRVNDPKTTKALEAAKTKGDESKYKTMLKLIVDDATTR